MNYLKERVAYLKGLAEGMQLNESTNEGKLLKAIIEVLDDVALAVDDIEEVQEEMSEQIDNIDEDLAEIEQIVFEDMYDEYDDGYIGEFACPHCSEKVSVYEDMLDDDAGNTVECPHCHKDVEIEWECDCEHHNEEQKEE